MVRNEEQHNKHIRPLKRHEPTALWQICILLPRPCHWHCTVQFPYLLSTRDKFRKTPTDVPGHPIPPSNDIASQSFPTRRWSSGIYLVSLTAYLILLSLSLAVNAAFRVLKHLVHPTQVLFPPVRHEVAQNCPESDARN